MDHKTNKEQVIEECEKIETLLLLLAAAASRLFSAPVDEPDFETADGPEYARALRRLRTHCERVAQFTEGIDADLDVALHKYSMDCIRRNPYEAKPLLFQIN